MKKIGLTIEDEKVLNVIPKGHLKGVECITRMDNLEIMREILSTKSDIRRNNLYSLLQRFTPRNNGEVTLGLYTTFEDGTAEIFLNDRYANEHTLAHEVGHNVWHNARRFNLYTKAIIPTFSKYLGLSKGKKLDLLKPQKTAKFISETFADSYAYDTILKYALKNNSERAKALGIDEYHK